MRVRRAAILFMFILSILLTGCGGKEYSGFEIDNKESITEALRGAMIGRSYALDIDFTAHTLDDSMPVDLGEEILRGVFYESEDPKGGDYLKYQYGGCSMEYDTYKDGNEYRYNIRLIPEYYTTADEEEYVDNEISRITDNLGLDKVEDEYSKVKLIRDYICENVTYDTVHKHMSGSGHVQSTAYGCLYYHTALCQGYAVLAYRMLKEQGLDARIITGDLEVNGKTERHAWNIVRIGNEYYNLDITMDDITGSYDYFLKSDESFNVDHRRDADYDNDTFVNLYQMSGRDYIYE